MTEQLANQFFADCATEGRAADRESLNAWLWFSCPADLRGPVRGIIESDGRYQQGKK